MRMGSNSILRASFEGFLIALILFLIGMFALTTYNEGIPADAPVKSQEVILCCAPKPEFESIPEPVYPESKIEGQRINTEQGVWPYKYAIRFDGKTVTLILRINFMFQGDWTEIEKQKYREDSKQDVEAIWNGRMRLQSGEASYPAVLEIRDGEDQTVSVYRDDSRSAMRTWHGANLKPVFKAHEIGHMIGLYDEYKQGSLPKTATMSKDGLMGMGPFAAKMIMYKRYYEPWLSYMGKDFVLAEE